MDPPPSLPKPNQTNEQSEEMVPSPPPPPPETPSSLQPEPEPEPEITFRKTSLPRLTLRQTLKQRSQRKKERLGKESLPLRTLVAIPHYTKAIAAKRKAKAETGTEEGEVTEEEKKKKREERKAKEEEKKKVQAGMQAGIMRRARERFRVEVELGRMRRVKREAKRELKRKEMEWRAWVAAGGCDDNDE